MKRLFILLAFLSINSIDINAQPADCPYPIIFMHGWTGNSSSFAPVYNNGSFAAVWGPISDVFHAVINATTNTHIWGVDEIQGTPDDDVLVQFVNETNVLSPGCVYAINFQNFWNEDQSNPVLDLNGCSSPGFFESDSNESAILKQGYALGKMIEKVLAANPSKQKVILVGHSMGGLEAREYLQRRVPETPTGTPRWWVDPSVADGHKVAKLVTTVTPHRGSNTLGNISGVNHPDPANKDGAFDIASEAVRDMRYNYACGFLGLDDCSGVYLFGGNENDFITFPYGYWNEDVDCDGDETSSAVVGINIAGPGDPWDGTSDNPQIPLPTNIRYTWITSDFLLDNGDGVVALSRQWIYNGNTPAPSDGTPHRLSDTLLTNVFHTNGNSNPNLIVRGLDEGDYPVHSWNLNLDVVYGALVQVRASQVPEGPNSTDPDWFKFTSPGVLNNDLDIIFTPHPGLAGRIDFFGTNPSQHAPMTNNGSINQAFASGSGQISLTIPMNSISPDTEYYFRVIHQGVGYENWTTPYSLLIQSIPPLPLDLLSFTATPGEKIVTLYWETALEQDLRSFQIERAGDDQKFEVIGILDPTNNLELNTYSYVDEQPIGGHSYYRLHIIEADDSRQNSPVRAVYFEMPFEIMSLYPQPVKDQLFIDLNSQYEDPLEIRVYDSLGRQIAYRKENRFLGETTLVFETSGWPRGLLIVEVKQGEIQWLGKVIN